MPEHRCTASTSAADTSATARQAAQVTALLDQLDSVDDSKYRNRRATARNSFRRTNVAVHVHHPGGSTSVRHVATRNLSASGIGFLYPSFLHIGTRAEVQLERRLGGLDLLRGSVVYCAHVGGVHHQAGIRFEAKIFPKLYLDGGAADRGEGDGAAARPASGVVAAPKGNVLLIDDGQMDRVLMGHHLKGTEATLTAVADERAALKALRTTQFDAVLCDLNLETSTGESTIAALRRAGYHGPICVVTAERASSRLEAALRAGAVAVLPKPYDQAKLFALLAGGLSAAAPQAGSAAAAAAQATLPTTLPLTPQTEALIAKYVADVNGAAARLTAAVQAQQVDLVRTCCLSLRGSATSYGFAPLHEAAREALRALDAGNSLDESAMQVRALAELCRRVVVRK